MASLREQVIAKARGQLGVRYYSMHTGPKGSAVPGWGCAMFYAWCLNQVLGTSYYGSCWNFAGDALGSGYLNQGGGEFEFVSATDVQPGDAVLYIARGYDGRDADDYGHIALYIGNGRVIGAMGQGVPGASNYLNIGIKETAASGQTLGGGWRYIRCKRLPLDESTEVFPLNRTVTVQSDFLRVRDKPSTATGKEVARYSKGDKVTIDGVTIGDDGYMWGHYVGASSGKDRYIALGTAELAR